MLRFVDQEPDDSFPRPQKPTYDEYKNKQISSYFKDGTVTPIDWDLEQDQWQLQQQQNQPRQQQLDFPFKPSPRAQSTPTYNPGPDTSNDPIQDTLDATGWSIGDPRYQAYKAQLSGSSYSPRPTRRSIPGTDPADA